MEELMPVVYVICRFVLVLVFVAAAVAKITDRGGTRQALEDFRLPSLLIAPFTILLPLAELAVAALLILPTTVTLGAVGALGLLAAFIVLIGITLAQGRQPECHCFGQVNSAPIGWTTIARNLALSGLA